MTVPLHALTLWCPWAAIVVDGPKDIENRTWRPPAWIIGKPMAIHAGKFFDEPGAEWIAEKVRELGVACAPRLALLEARGAIIGTAIVEGFHPPADLISKPTNPWHIPDQFGWILAERRALATPIPVRGAQGLWRIADDVRARMGA